VFPRRSKRSRDGLWRDRRGGSGLCFSAWLAQGFAWSFAGCVMPSVDMRQLRQCENRQSLFLPLPWYDTLRFWCLEKFAQLSPRQLLQNSAIKVTQLEDADIHAIMP
jgi:hypothetical protein